VKPYPPVNLDRFAGNSGSRFRSKELCHGRLLVVRETVVLVPCCPIDQEASRIDLGRHIRNHPLDRLERGDGLTELDALLGI